MADTVRIDGATGNPYLIKDVGGGNFAPAQVASATVKVQAAFSRPNNVTPYAAGQALSDSTSAPTAFQLAGCARANGGTGIVTDVEVIDEAVQATPAELELWLFNGPYTASGNTNDGGTFQPALADLRANLIGVVALPSSASYRSGNARVYQASNLGLAFKVLSPNATSLYFALVVRNAYTPVANERFDVNVGISQD